MSNPLVKAVLKGRGAAKGRRAHPGALNDLSGVDATKAAIRDAEATGLPMAATKGTADRVAEVERQARVIDSVDKELAGLGKGIATTLDELRALARQPSLPKTAALFRALSLEDRRFLAAKALELAKSTARSTHNNMSGYVREVVAKHLPELRLIVHDEIQMLRRTAPSRRSTSTLDTGTKGPVHLRTYKKKGNREVELGTDRLVGRASGSPQRVDIEWPSGDKESVWVMGELDVTIAIEVKGRTNAFEGLRQLQRLRDRGGGGYAVIDGRLWLLKYDPTKVKHIVVAPPGGGLEAVKAAKAAKGSGGVANLEVIEISQEIDKQIHALTRHFQEAAAKAQEVAPR